MYKILCVRIITFSCIRRMHTNTHKLTCCTVSSGEIVTCALRRMLAICS